MTRAHRKAIQRSQRRQRAIWGGVYAGDAQSCAAPVSHRAGSIAIPDRVPGVAINPKYTRPRTVARGVQEGLLRQFANRVRLSMARLQERLGITRSKTAAAGV